jgi:hypothetical protein
MRQEERDWLEWLKRAKGGVITQRQSTPYDTPDADVSLKVTRMLEWRSRMDEQEDVCYRPRREDRLLQQEPPTRTQARDVALLGHETRDDYAIAYRDAAGLLSAFAIKHEIPGHLIYPIVFCYRHHIELVFKDLITGMLSYHQQPPNKQAQRALKGHDLQELWKTLLPLLVATAVSKNWPVTREDAEGIGSYVQQLHEIDPRSDAFRYETTKGGKTSLQTNYVLLSHFRELMDRFCNYLEFLTNCLKLQPSMDETQRDIDRLYEQYPALDLRRRKTE